MKIISTHPSNYNVANEIPVTAFNRDGKKFSADASILEHSGYRFTNQLYYDAADQGFLLVNPETQNAVPFVLDRVDRVDGDIAGWRFKPDTYSVQKNQGIAGLSILIVNS